ncbi:MAG: hypothetical protein LBQ03_01405 [Puniceicoccales bacterium]|jgi:hypothetical protein|nr:hypothetical protein [Puniceicoccales bacterium]
MNKWLAIIVFRIFSLLTARATEMPTPNTASASPDGDIPQTLLPAIAPVETGNYWKITLLSLAVAGILALILILFLRRRRSLPPTKPLSSFQLFLRDLHRARLHAKTKDTKEFCTALCFALKSYVQREYQLPITCRTTEEFLKIVQNSSKFSWEIASDLTDILQYSDQAKFAGIQFQSDFHRDLFLKTCRFVREVKRIRHPAKPVIKPIQK